MSMGIPATMVDVNMGANNWSQQERINRIIDIDRETRIAGVSKRTVNEWSTAASKLKSNSKLPSRARRQLSRLVSFAVKACKPFATIPNECYHASLIRQTIDSDHGWVIIDSGTVYHIVRDESKFASIESGQGVKIRGINGVSYGKRGILRDCELGSGIPAICFPSSPVEILLSAEGLKANRWETHFTDEGNYLLNRTTSTFIELHQINGLPTCKIEFSTPSFICTPDTEIYDTQSKIPHGSRYSNKITKNTHYTHLNLPKTPETKPITPPTNPNPIPNPTNSTNNLPRGTYDTSRKRARENHAPPKLIRNSKHISKLLLHWRNAHFHDPENRVECLECIENKGRRKGHSKVRNPKFGTPGAFLLFSTDFFGKVKPTSYRHNKWVMLYVDDHSGYAYAKCIPRKSDAPEVLEEFIKFIRRKCGAKYGETKNDKGQIIFAGIRSDNEPVLRSTDWTSVCDRFCISETHSIPYEPEQNGTCERLVQSVKNSLRTCMSHVDSRVWDYGVYNILNVWNLRKSEKATKSLKSKTPKCPQDVLESVSTNPLVKSAHEKRQYLRRFGCLAYFLPHRMKTTTEEIEKANAPLLPKKVKGIYLGLSPHNSGWLIGHFHKGRLEVYETRNAVFLEDILVNNVEELSKQDPPMMEQLLVRLNALAGDDPSAGSPKGLAGECGDYRLKGLDVSQWSDGVGDETRMQQQGLIESLKLTQRHITQGSSANSEGINPAELELEEESSDGESLKRKPAKSKKTKPKSDEAKAVGTCDPKQNLNDAKSDTKSDVLPSASVDARESRANTKDSVEGEAIGAEAASSEVTYGPSAIRRRGRPRGAKDKNPNKRKRRTKATMRAAKEATQERCSTLFAEEISAENEVYSHLAWDPHPEHGDEDEILEAEVFLAREVIIKESQAGDSVKPTVAFNPANPERPKWVEAKTLEQTRLEAYTTWRKLTPEEEKLWREGKIQAVPCALLLNRKRDGRFKARLVVLGNRWKPNDEDNAVYASVVSQVGNRACMVQIAREGFHPIPFDISNAFVRASMGSIQVCVRLPESFRDVKDDKDDGKRMLLKALYGLPISPRLWAKTLSKDLEKLGWQECKHEPGVWSLTEKGKVVGYMTVYVDDCILACNSIEKTKLELDRVHKTHPLKVIETTVSAEGTIAFDMTGVDVEINPSLRTLRISMRKYSEKLLKRFDMTNCKGRSNPAFPEEKLFATNADKSPFPFRECVGALQWLATNCRPDLAHSTNMLARASCMPVTTSMAGCCRMVMRYLKATLDQAITYSPESEAEFEEKFSKLSEHADNAKVDKSQAHNAVHTFTDASFGVTYKEMRSISGVVIYLYGTPIAWKSKVQTVFASSTTESEWIAMSDGIEVGQSVSALYRFLIGDPVAKLGPLWCDNRGATLSARQRDVTDIAKKTRHVALKHAKVLTEGERVWFCPTLDQKADGLTKSVNSHALEMIFTHNPLVKEEWDDAEESELEFELSDTFLSMQCEVKKNVVSREWERNYSLYCEMDIYP